MMNTILTDTPISVEPTAIRITESRCLAHLIQFKSQ
jgi:hypothetical protein